jgi:hypothetical protein
LEEGGLEKEQVIKKENEENNPISLLSPEKFYQIKFNKW